jgi:hypothetical protein
MWKPAVALGVFAIIAGSGIEVNAYPVGSLKAVACKFGVDGKFTSEKEFVTHKKHQEIEDYKYFDKNCNGILEDTELSARDQYLKFEVEDGARAEYARYRANNVDVPVPPSKDPPTPEIGGWHSQPILRDSFEDIAVFRGPKDVKLASGATFSYAYDGELRNRIWSAKGVVAYPISWTAPPVVGRRPAHVPYLVGMAFSPSFAFQRVSNSNSTIAKKSDVDVAAFGAGGEIAIGKLTDEITTHYFRARAAGVTNFAGETRSWNVVGEYQPLTNWSDIPNLGTPNPLGELPFTYQLDAILRAHYARKMGDKVTDPLFNEGEKVFRVGPVLMFSMRALQGASSPVPKALQKATFNASYSWLDDVRRSHSYSHFMTSLGYALDDAGNIAIKLSYDKGKIEETAQDVAITRVGLTAKY